MGKEKCESSACLVVDNATYIATTAQLNIQLLETLTINGISQDVSLVSGITKVNVGTAGVTKTFSKTLLIRQALVFKLTETKQLCRYILISNATGTTDVLTLNLGTGLLSTASTDLNTSLVVTGFYNLKFEHQSTNQLQQRQTAYLTLRVTTASNHDVLTLPVVVSTIANGASSYSSNYDRWFCSYWCSYNWR